MNTPLKILVATDYSDAATDAEGYAVKLGQKLGAQLVFLHVYQASFDPVSGLMELAEKTEAAHSSELRRLEERCRTIAGPLDPSEFKYVVREGSHTGELITTEADAQEADLIVIGTHGASGFHKLFFGSRAWDVIKRSAIPVLAVPKGAPFRGINHIVFGTEYRNTELDCLNYLLEFAKPFDADITVLHITNYVLTKKFEREMFQKFKTEVAGKFNYPRLKMNLMVNQNISAGVNKFCTDNRADLLVMSPERPSLFGKFFITNMSMTRKAIFHAHIPVLAIPDTYHKRQKVTMQPVHNPEFH